MTRNLTARKCRGFKTPAEVFPDVPEKSLTIRFNASVALGL